MLHSATCNIVMMPGTSECRDRASEHAIAMNSWFKAGHPLRKADTLQRLFL